MKHVAVLDIGKTNVKLSIATGDGVMLESVSTGNELLAGPPYLHPDAEAIEAWFLDQLGNLARRHTIDAVVATSHGSLGALVGGGRLLMPPVDYENEPSEALNRRYAELAGSLAACGSPIMPGFAHMARQMLFLETEWPETVAEAEHYLGGPQYWAWRLSAIAASEVTYLGAQSHLWNVGKARYLPIVASRGWQRLLPPIEPAWRRLGAIRPDLVRRHGLPEGIGVLCGIHDSSANFYRYQQAGLSDVALISTGTWIVGLGDIRRPDDLVVSEQRLCNADVHGKPLAGVLAMGGREFAALAGDAGEGTADVADVARLLAGGTMPLPSFSDHDVLFPGTAGKGRIDGLQPATPGERRALALLYVALLTDTCLDVLGEQGTTVLDGSFVRDPLYPALVAALRPKRRTLFNTEANGTASGAALLASHDSRDGPAPVDLRTPMDIDLPGLADYATRWRRATGGRLPIAKDI
ncbi:MAG: carbohydrate kinase [Bauldia litoralis]